MIRTTLWCLALAGIGLIFGAYYGFTLPEVVPIHWGPDGQPDAFGAPGWLLWLMPLVVAVLPLLIMLAAKMSRRQEHVARSWPAVSTIVVGLAACTMALHVMILRAMATPEQTLTSATVLLPLAILRMVLGNVMPKLKSQGFAGIRTPWTMKSDKVWHQTHRLAGWSFAIGGLAAVVVCLVGPAEPSTWGMLTLLLLPAIIPVIYSYFAWKNLNSDAARG